MITKRHNKLNRDIFDNSNYIKTLELCNNYSNFKKQFPEQYNATYDILSTFINCFNILFADRNDSIQDRIIDLQVEMENCLFGDKDNDSRYYKYSRTFISILPDDEVKYIYNNLILKCYKNLENDYDYNTIKNKYLKEMLKLESSDFDKKYKNNLEYKNFYNSDYKIYYSSLSDYNSLKLKAYYDLIQDYQKYNEVNSLTITIIQYLSQVISYGINGLSIKLYNSEDIKISEDNNYYFDYYLQRLNINIPITQYYIIKKSFTSNIFLLHTSLNFDFNELVNNYDYYMFMEMAKEITELNIQEKNKYMFLQNELLAHYKNRTSYTQKLIDNIIKAYNLITNNNLVEAHKLLSSFIESNKKLFMRVS